MDQVSISSSQFQAVTAPKINLVGEGQGINIWVLGVFVTLKALGNETGGLYSLFEDAVPPGTGPGLHFHTSEDETWYMLDGELLWIVGDQQFNASKGSFIHLPRLVPHAFSNRSSRQALMLVTYTPGGFERWFLDVGKEVIDIGSPSPEVTKEYLTLARKLAEKYGVFFLEQHKEITYASD